MSTERNAHRQNLGVALAEKIMFVADNMSHHQYVPKTPNQNEVDLVFDTGFDIVQPYLFRVGITLHMLSLTLSDLSSNFFSINAVFMIIALLLSLWSETSVKLMKN